MIENFWKHVSEYGYISEPSKAEWLKCLTRKRIAKKDFFLREGSTPHSFAFVEIGLLNYFYLNEQGDPIIKKFFPENTFVASMSALVNNSISVFSIQALEDTTLWVFDAATFRGLCQKYSDIACFYINYLEQNWIVEKEMQEIWLKSQTAKIRYEAFIEKYPHLVHRLNLQDIASYLGITATQLSRIRRSYLK